MESRPCSRKIQLTCSVDDQVSVEPWEEALLLTCRAGLVQMGGGAFLPGSSSLSPSGLLTEGSGERPVKTGWRVWNQLVCFQELASLLRNLTLLASGLLTSSGCWRVGSSRVGWCLLSSSPSVLLLHIHTRKCVCGCLREEVWMARLCI